MSGSGVDVICSREGLINAAVFFTVTDVLVTGVFQGIETDDVIVLVTLGLMAQFEIKADVWVLIRW